MKRNVFAGIATLSAILCLSVSAPLAASPGGGGSHKLSEDEVADLMFMREEEKLARDASVMSESEVKRLKRDILARQRKLKNAQAEFREDFNLRRNEEFNKLRRQVAEVVRALGKEENIDLIISDGVVYFSKRVDISERVLERLRENFKSSKKK